MKTKLYLIDGMSVVFRAYYAMAQSNLVNKNSEPTGAIFGFVNIITSLLERLEIQHIAVCFDCREATFRHKLYPNYKANRVKFPEDLAIQLPYIKKFLDYVGINRIELPGYEADDIIGTYSLQASHNGMEVFCYTSDKDFYQLLNENIHIIRNSKDEGKSNVDRGKNKNDEGKNKNDEGKNKNDEGKNWFEVIKMCDVKEKFGVNVEEVCDYLALIGDASDNVPGVKGIGQKTAVPLIEKYKNIETIYANLHNIERPRIKQLLADNKEDAFLSKRLVTIDRDVPLDRNYADLGRKEVDYAELDALFSYLGLRQQREKWNNFRMKEQNYMMEAQKSSGEVENSYIEVEKSSVEVENSYMKVEKINADGVNYLIDKLNSTNEVAIYMETDVAKRNDAKIMSIAFSNSYTEAYYLPFVAETEDLFGGENRIDVSKNIIAALKDYLERADLLIVGHNIKNIAFILRKYGINLGKIIEKSSGGVVKSYVNGEKSCVVDYNSWSNLFDVSIAGYLLNTNDDLSLNGLAEKYLDAVPLCGDDGLMCNVGVIWRLHKVLQRALAENNLTELANNVEFPLISVLNDMEYTGIAVNTSKLAEQSRIIGVEINKKQVEIYSATGTEFNIDSPKQLAEVLTSKLGIDLGKKPSTDMQTLSEIASLYPVAATVLEYRHLSKLKHTYIDVLPRLIHTKTNRIHTTFNQIVANTGRLSSSDPNLQNIPIRTSIGKDIRAAFVSKDSEHLLLSADYSQIELRIMAYFSGDTNMIEAFNNGIDIHSATASAIHNCPIEQVDNEMRRTAKTINFGIIYGLGSFGLSQRLNIPRKVASAIINDYFNKFNGVKNYIDNSLAKVRELGYADTIIGRRRYFYDINNKNHNIRTAVERAAINMPIQGSASDMIKISMLNIFNEFNKQKVNAKMLLQVHDELLFEVPLNEIDKVKEIVKNNMITALSLGCIPVEVSIGIGNNWLEAH